MKLYFTRHGKTEWNLEQRFQGMTGDSPLLPSSYQEIKKLGQSIKNIHFEKVYASTSKRAQDTAQGIVSELDQPTEIIYSDDLRELGLGELEGRSIHGRRKHYAEIMDNMRHHLDRYDPAPFKGEPIEMAIKRVAGVVEQAVAHHSGPLLFVGHGASLTAAIQWLTGKDIANLRDQGGLLNSSLSILKTEEPENQLPYELIKWNDTSFL